MQTAMSKAGKVISTIALVTIGLPGLLIGVVLQVTVSGFLTGRHCTHWLVCQAMDALRDYQGRS